jgi:hypothetical protein
MMAHMFRRAVFVVVLLTMACSAPNGGGSLFNRAPTPTEAPAAPRARELPGRGIEVDGQGNAQTDDITPDYAGGLNLGIDVVTLTHDGRSSFIVTATQGDQSEKVTSAIGAYQGQRPLVVEGPVSFQVTADGNWTLRIQPMSTGGSPAFSGTGDAVSAYFDPPAPSTWNISYSGQT